LLRTNRDWDWDWDWGLDWDWDQYWGLAAAVAVDLACPDTAQLQPTAVLQHKRPAQTAVCRAYWGTVRQSSLGFRDTDLRRRI
jgi:hypothetical protein